MASITSHSYDCQNQSIDVEVNAAAGEGYRVYGQAFPAGTNSCSNFPPEGTTFLDDDGGGTTQIIDPSFPNMGQVDYCVWLIQVADADSGTGDCTSSSSSSSS